MIVKTTLHLDVQAAHDARAQILGEGVSGMFSVTHLGPVDLIAQDPAALHRLSARLADAANDLAREQRAAATAEALAG